MNSASKLGIPVIGEFFPSRSDLLSPEEMHEQVYSSCRILSELGTDMIKTFHTHKFKEVTQSCPVPIFGLGATKAPTQLGALKLAHFEIMDGAKGVVFGRNAIQVKDPSAFQAALCHLLKRGIKPEEVIKKYKLVD